MHFYAIAVPSHRLQSSIIVNNRFGGEMAVFLMLTNCKHFADVVSHF